MNPRSLRFRLTAWHTGVLTAVFLLLGALIFVRIKSQVEGTLFEVQARRARQIAETLVARGGAASLAGTIETLYVPEQSDRFIRITRRDGYVAYVSGRPNSQAFDPAEVEPAFAEATARPAVGPWPDLGFRRKSIRAGGSALLIAGFPVSAADGVGYLVEVGTSAAPVDQMLRQLALLLGLGLPIVILVAVGGGYALVGQALRPVEQMTTKAAVITQHNLGERLPVEATGDELERLADSLNRMISRLESSFQNSKRFVADASHELRTPLTVLRGELEHLAKDSRMDAETSDRLGSLLEEVERLSRIVEQLLALSRLDAGEAKAEAVRVNLSELAAATADQMNLLAEDKRIAVECHSDRPVWVQGDRARLKQVVVNLLDNAIKYTAGGGAVILQVSASEGHAVLEISDTGSGIPEAAQAHVFDRFYRVDAARSRQTEGAGLGLAIVKSICSAHGGEIELESTVGRGSTFRVKLPLAA